MNTALEYQTSTVPAPRSKRRNRKVMIWFIAAWLILVGGGLWGAKWYTDQVKQQMLNDLTKQNEQQAAELKQQMEARITALSSELNEKLVVLDEKVQTFNELLAFANENASSKSDNSTQLYTQLAEIKKQLDTLKQNLDLLK